ncbi:MAG: tRNA (guanosine(46)-N7)-methyltransferase TrmB [Alphaproteobacteria bacterium]|nr:tRNA (guanosine(46)-N7)-methyltransferase TrmB [Alphaproteobacteria bacterium]
MDGKRILYGRRRGRRLRPNRQEQVDRLLPQIAVDLERLSESPAGAFAGPVRDVWLEVGFGGGEHLFRQAQLHPDIGIVGCEPFLNGVARLVARIDDADAPPGNIRVFHDDARVLIERLPAASIGRVFVLFPDPWPKSRHQRRRFIAPAQLDALARVMRPGAELRLATDHMGYLRWMLLHCLAHDGFRWLAAGPADWRSRPDDWPPTRYESKAIDRGAFCAYLRFVRRAAACGDRRNGNKNLVERAKNA